MKKFRKKFGNSKNIRTSAPLEPAKPLNDAQMCGSFFIFTMTDTLRIYLNLCIIKYFLNIISPQNDMKAKLDTLLAHYPNIDIAAMGFPQGWENELLWQ